MYFQSNDRGRLLGMVNLNSISIFIPACGGSRAFQDDLLRRLGGTTLIQRAVDKAISSGAPREQIFVLTNSEEIELISDRNGVKVVPIEGDLQTCGLYMEVVAEKMRGLDVAVWLSPYAPGLKTETIIRACDALLISDKQVLVPTQKRRYRVSNSSPVHLDKILMRPEAKSSWIESDAFTIFRKSALDYNSVVPTISWEVGEDAFVINSLSDWWVCEKLLTRKRIIFRVVGNDEVGMGHIYRALTLAHEITDHEVLFVSSEEDSIALNQLAGYDYWLGLYPSEEITNSILELKPDLVVNDILDTDKAYIKALTDHEIKVVNFEDMGGGVGHADLAINELYDDAMVQGGNVYWGRDYFFVRDEFADAIPHVFQEKVTGLLLTFGGTDQHDLSRKIYHVVKDLCRAHGVTIYIVAGPGYKEYQHLVREVAKDDNVSVTHATGVISSIMENTQLAITSNGRTVYELAHMSIPSIVISQHDRERTHAFACEENGVIPLDLYREGITEERVLKVLERLILDVGHRLNLFNSISRFEFSRNKAKVLNLILSLLDKG